MTTRLETFLIGAAEAVKVFDDWAKQFMPAAKADHVCYKCSDSGEFEALRALFEVPESYLYQSWIAGRRIAIVKFAAPIPTALGPISFLELSDQKPDGSQTSGFDHVEIFPTASSVEDLAASLERQGIAFEKVVRPHHTTYDAMIAPGFKVRLEAEALVEKIKREEMV